MPQKIRYRFAEFELDSDRQRLLHNGELVALPQKALDLLLELVASRGETVDRSALIKRVWGLRDISDSSINTFNVTLSSVRRALGESGRKPRFIYKVSDGYRFIGEVTELSTKSSPSVGSSDISDPFDPVSDDVTANEDSISANTTDGQAIHSLREENVEPTAGLSLEAAKWAKPLAINYRWHIIVASVLYSLLYAIALMLEVAYEFDRFGRSALALAPAVLGWMMLFSVVGLAIDRKLNDAAKSGGGVIVVTIFLVSAAFLFAAISLYLPSSPVTKSTLQAYPAPAAYLKDMTYFLFLVFFFLIMPFHFVVTAEREIRQQKFVEVLALISGKSRSLGLRNAIYPRFGFLVLLLSAMGIASLLMTSRLLDHLRPATYLNLFMQLVYFRVIVYFCLGIECLIWYYQALTKLQLACSSRAIKS
jgi:DNA-binding winged helix-turn-helix (wHTH) protein